MGTVARRCIYLGSRWKTLYTASFSRLVVDISGGYEPVMHKIRLRKTWCGFPYHESEVTVLELDGLKTIPFGSIQAKIEGVDLERLVWYTIERQRLFSSKQLTSEY